MSCDCYCPVALPQGAVGWSVVSNCGIFHDYTYLLLKWINYVSRSAVLSLRYLENTITVVIACVNCLRRRLSYQ